MRVAAILPCRGRADQTVRNVTRMLATAGAVDWQLTLVGAAEDVRPFVQTQNLASLLDPLRVSVLVLNTARATYWQALAAATAATDAPLLCNLANDLLPGQHWLARAVAAYAATFGEGPGLMGLNDGHHETEHSCHFLISRSLLVDYGGWPIWYDHAYGDTELCQRAIADTVYAKAPYATLFHDHPFFGGTDDPIYAEGRAQAAHDMQTYERRRANGWKT